MADIIDLDDSDESMGEASREPTGEDISEDASEEESNESEAEESSEVLEEAEGDDVSMLEDEHNIREQGQEIFAGARGFLRAGDSYSDNGAQSIIHNRRKLGGELFFDRLTKQLKVKDGQSL
jgi:hypothetical protein